MLGQTFSPGDLATVAVLVLLEGVLSIVEGLNPKLIRTKLDAYLQEQHAGGKKAAAAKGSGAGQPVSAEG